MADNPALPVWTDAYLADTHPGLSLDEHGCYFLMMMLAWRLPGCRLPDDDHYIAARLNIPVARFQKKYRKKMLEFWKISDGFWSQKRLTKEHNYIQNKREQAREAGIASAKAKKTKETRPTDVEQPLQRNANGKDGDSTDENTTPTPTPTPIREKYKKEFEEWYSAYPRHKGRGQAERAYRTARKKASAETLLEAGKRYAAQRVGEDKNFTKHPATWLNGECWLDDPPDEKTYSQPFDAAIAAMDGGRRQRIDRCRDVASGIPWRSGWDDVPEDPAEAAALLERLEAG